MFLGDLSVEGVNLFLSEPVARGGDVFVVIEQPKHLFIRGKVLWSTLSQLNLRVLSAESYRYRARVCFVYASREERQLVQNYFKSIFA